MVVRGLVRSADGGSAARGVAALAEATCPWSPDGRRPFAGRSPDDCLFAAGYLDAGGPERYLRHLVEDVRPCEGEWGVEYVGVHVSAFQFDRGSWATVARATGMGDPLDPYHVGANVAWWITRIDDPGSTAGWPHCWWRGSIP